MGECTRKLSHRCRYREDHVLLIIGNDYSNVSRLMALDSVLNDISLIWRYFRRYQCFSREQIFIGGSLDTSGKMLPWKKRMISPKKQDLDGKKIYFYYTGHGYPSGRIDISQDILSLISPSTEKSMVLIVDSCWAHKWVTSRFYSYICATNECMEVATSSQKISVFTYELVKFLTRETVSREDFFKWADERNYLVKLETSFLDLI